MTLASEGKTNAAPNPGTRGVRPIAFVTVVAGLCLGTWIVLRVVLWLIVAHEMTLSQALAAFGRGLWFDLATVAYLIVPWLLVNALAPNRWRQSRTAVRLGWACLWFVVASLLFGAAAELVFWQEFSTRFNFIAVDYLIYTKEVIGNIRQSYPVGWIITGIAVLALTVVFVLSRFITLRQEPITLRARAAVLALIVLLPFGSYRLSSVDQLASGNAYADELAGNGLYTLAAAMRRNELDYDRFYKTIPQERADAVLKALGVERLPLSRAVSRVDDEHEPDEMGAFTRRPKNIVLISVESLSASFVGAYGSTQGLTPNLDRIAKEGLKFERIFATGTRTVRGLEALSLGTPPIPGQAIVRRPGNEHLATVGEFLEHQGFSTFFIYGGYGYFDNMNAYFRGNHYEIVDRTDFPEQSVVFETIWGVADEVLFANSLNVLDKAVSRGKPFFAHIMTTSNHRPYTYPQGRIDIPSPGGREGAVKYTDYAIGQFIDQAKNRPWFKDTLFVIVADHCASVAGKTRLPMENYLIPMIFYAPDMLPPGVYSRMASQIDVPPTLLDLAGAKGDDHFFGQSLFEATSTPERAFISNYQELGYFEDRTLVVLSPKQAASAFKIDLQSYASTPVAVPPRQLEEAISYYQTASRAFKTGALLNPDYQRGSKRAAAR